MVETYHQQTPGYDLTKRPLSIDLSTLQLNRNIDWKKNKGQEGGRMRKIRFNTNNYGLSTVLFKDRIYTSVMNVTGAKK